MLKTFWPPCVLCVLRFPNYKGQTINHRGRGCRVSGFWEKKKSKCLVAEEKKKQVPCTRGKKSKCLVAEEKKKQVPLSRGKKKASAKSVPDPPLQWLMVRPLHQWQQIAWKYWSPYENFDWDCHLPELLYTRDGPIPHFCRYADMPRLTFANMPILESCSQLSATFFSCRYWKTCRYADIAYTDTSIGPSLLYTTKNKHTSLISAP